MIPARGSSRSGPPSTASAGRNLGLGIGDLPALAMVCMMMIRREQPERNVRPRPLLERPAPWISVVVPCLSEGGLARTIRSIVAQDYPPTEIIVVNRGSADGTHKVLGELGARAVVLTVPAGESEMGAIKAGLDAASGEYLICLPGGDVLLPGALDRVRVAVRRKSYRVMWFCEMEDCEFQGERARPAGQRPGVSIRTLLKGDVPHPSSVAIRRTVYLKATATAGARLVGIRDLWFRLACRTRFRRFEGSLGCRCGSARAIGEQDVQDHAREFERAVASVREQMRWPRKVMGVGRHVLARLDDVYRGVRKWWVSKPSRRAHGETLATLSAGGPREPEPNFGGGATVCRAELGGMSGREA